MLPGKRFDSIPSLEWLEFIVMNRKRNVKSELIDEPRHTHCWVSGPIADDKIADVVENYLTGDINSAEAIALARALPQVFQLSLHTQSSLSVIDENSVQINRLLRS